MNINWGGLYGCGKKENRERNKRFQRKLGEARDKLGSFGTGIHPVPDGLPKLSFFGGNLCKSRIIECIFPIYIRDREDIENIEELDPVIAKNQLEVIDFDISLFKYFLKENKLEFIELDDKIIIIHHDKITISKLIWNFLNCFHITECQKIIIEEE